MLPREDFIFTIGYDGPTAVVDKQAKKKFGSLSTRELAEKGLFRAAYSSAVYSKKPEELALVAEIYNQLIGRNTENLPNPDLAALERLFGVSEVDVKRSISL